jgi:hypothetical protein
MGERAASGVFFSRVGETGRLLRSEAWRGGVASGLFGPKRKARLCASSFPLRRECQIDGRAVARTWLFHQNEELFLQINFRESLPSQKLKFSWRYRFTLIKIVFVRGFSSLSWKILFSWEFVFYSHEISALSRNIHFLVVTRGVTYTLPISRFV